jgi:DNA repair protein RecN (Recombination protein N)
VLEELRIADLGVIARATVPCGPGLSVLTGETGAGKTMVLTALALLLGGRADPGLVRPGAARAVVEGRWRLPADHPAVVATLEAGGDLDDDGALVVVRTVGAEGRSRAVLGGAGVPASRLAGLADGLVAVHGQADQQRLSRPAVQRDLVDRYADLAPRVAAYREVHDQLAAARRAAADVTDRAAARATEADGLRHGLDVVGALGPVPGEQELTSGLVARLTHAEALAAATAEAYARLADGEESDARGQLVHAGRLLQQAAGLDPTLSQLADRVAELALLAGDVASEVTAYAAGLVVDPAALAAAHERTAALTAAVRRYVPGQDAAALAAWSQAAGARLTELEGDEGRRDELAAAVTALTEQRNALAGMLTAARREAGDRLAAAAGRELAGLAMAGARLEVEVSAAEPGPAGADVVTLQLAAHPGAPLRPVARAASGGELSRVMLALEVALAGADDVATMVFDEVDAGVGGAAAVEVGRRLAALGRRHQVIVVTHLPQVAAFADHHVRVVKDATGDVTTSTVTVLAPADRRGELARMLGGLDGSDAALGTAAELLALAHG